MIVLTEEDDEELDGILEMELDRGDPIVQFLLWCLKTHQENVDRRRRMH